MAGPYEQTSSLVKVLIIEDDPDFVALLGLIFGDLSKEYEVEYVATYEEGRQKILDGNHDIYLVDYFLDLGNTGDSLIDEAARRGYPTVMLTGSEDYKLRERIVRAGASDYIVKSDLTTSHIQAVINGALRG